MQQPQQSQQAQQGITHPPATSSIIPSEAVDTHHTPMPEVPLHFPELAGLSEAQLERLVADESALKVRALLSPCLCIYVSSIDYWLIYFYHVGSYENRGFRRTYGVDAG
jgi:hypothetical protein